MERKNVGGAFCLLGTNSAAYVSQFDLIPYGYIHKRMFSKKEYSQMQATASIADNQSFALAPNLRVQHPSLEQASDSKLSPSDPNVPATTTPTERETHSPSRPQRNRVACRSSERRLGSGSRTNSGHVSTQLERSNRTTSKKLPGRKLPKEEATDRSRAL